MPRRYRLLVVAVGCAIATACGQPQPAPPPSAPPAPPTTGLAGSFTDVHVLADDVDATVYYKTRTSLRDCAAQRQEMPLVWHEHVRGRLTDVRWARITLFPEEPSGTSASFTFARRPLGEWRAEAPCVLTMAP